MSRVLDSYNALAKLPAGRRLFSFGYARRVPYFRTIKSRMIHLAPNYAALHLPNRKAVHNHIGIVHAIAVCNGLEAAMGALAEATIPAGKRWLPKGMTVDYVAKSTTDLTCIAESDPADWEQGPEVPVRVKAVRTDGTVAVEGVITLWVTDKGLERSRQRERPGNSGSSSSRADPLPTADDA